MVNFEVQSTTTIIHNDNLNLEQFVKDSSGMYGKLTLQTRTAYEEDILLYEVVLFDD